MRIVALIAAALFASCAAASAPATPARSPFAEPATPTLFITTTAPTPTLDPQQGAPTATAVASAAPVATANTIAPPAASTPTATAVSTSTPTAVANAACGSRTTSTVSAASGPIAKTSVTTCYDFTGSSSVEMRANINANPARPKDQNTGVAFDAYTSYTWRVNWALATVAGTCRATSLTSTYAVEFTYPRWVAPPSAPTLLVVQWNAYVAALQTHEAGHDRNGIAAVNDAVTGIQAISIASCADFPAAAQVAINAAGARSKLADVSYDAATDHGATQGAHFP